MARTSRPLRLTDRHVALVQPESVSEEMPESMEGMERSTEKDHAETWSRLKQTAPAPDEIWFFAYGSLIWKPACDFVEMRTGLLRGWHRAFCLGWNTRWRGSEDNPGLMLALDRGGACKGVLYRLPPNDIESNIFSLFEREMAFKPSAFPPRWVNVATEEGNKTALTFCIDRNSGRYVSGLTPHRVAEVLATASGTRGSMAEYLYETVSHLEQMGLHDTHLWELQDLVADHIETMHGPMR
ncbi:gamma-glutamylcyclotransferase [Devosia pacifica]|uniref:glutathione-specific gamma-glutamylcyclotransferase n=1 Tax=Devosia pacifica TaxID=1335967 RepID=A0A918VU98_9HYPH|nr:gamma-glutamylcyclotransferase [Devosia pacifica]GHA26066.1 gamma-glutamylcyclotransferase [Devosia pacifica]